MAEVFGPSPKWKRWWQVSGTAYASEKICTQKYCFLGYYTVKIAATLRKPCMVVGTDSKQLIEKGTIVDIGRKAWSALTGWRWLAVYAIYWSCAMYWSVLKRRKPICYCWRKGDSEWFDQEKIGYHLKKDLVGIRYARGVHFSDSLKLSICDMD